MTGAGNHSDGPVDNGLIITAAALIWGLIVISAMGWRIARPVIKFARSATAMAAGDFRRRVRISTHDELEMLGNAFNSLGESVIQYEVALKRHAVMMAGMMEAARAASSSLDVKTCSRSIAKAVCVHLGAADAAVFIKDSNEGGLKVLGYHGHCQKAAWKRLANHSADSGGYLVLTESADGQNGTDALLVGVPLTTGADTIGAIVARFDNGAIRDDLKLGSMKSDLLVTYGIHAAAAIANAQMHSKTEKYSEVLEDWVEHLSAVMEVTNAISPTLNLDETLSELANSTAVAMGTDDCAIFLLDGDGKLIVRSCRDRRDVEISTLKIRPGELITGKAFAQRRHGSCSDLTKSLDPMIRSAAEYTGAKSIMSAPLIVEDQAIGAITVYNKNTHHFTPREVRLLTSIALHAAVIVRNAGQYTRQSSIAEQLQSTLVSEVPDSFMGLDFAGRYIPALDEARIGGDFYEVSVMPDGNVAVVIADVSGKGLMAAIHLAACKHMLKAMLFEYPDNPARALYELNNAMNHFFDLSFFMTVFCGVINPAKRNLTYVNAGHPPALLITENGKMQHLLAGTGMPVGSGQHCDYNMVNVDFNASDMLLLYTDGVTDAVTGHDAFGVEGVQKIAFKSTPCSPQALIDSIISALQQKDGAVNRDDIAMLAIAFNCHMQDRNETCGGPREQRYSISTHTFWN